VEWWEGVVIRKEERWVTKSWNRVGWVVVVASSVMPLDFAKSQKSVKCGIVVVKGGVLSLQAGFVWERDGTPSRVGWDEGTGSLTILVMTGPSSSKESLAWVLAVR
jgi:hypothetical protein